MKSSYQLPGLGRATFTPAELKIMAQAFNEAWTQIEGHFEPDSLEAQTCRIELAEKILIAAHSNHQANARCLKNAALQALALARARG